MPAAADRTLGFVLLTVFEPDGTPAWTKWVPMLPIDLDDGAESEPDNALHVRLRGATARASRPPGRWSDPRTN